MLTEWHKQGITTVKELEQAGTVQGGEPEEKTKQKSKSKSKNTTEGSIDWSLMDRIINGE